MALKDIFINTVKSLTFGDYIDTVAPSTYRGGVFNGMYFFGGNGVDYRFAYKDHHSAMNAYRICAPLSAVINRKAGAYITGTTQILNTQGKVAPATSLNSPAGRLKKLLNKPNPLQTWRQFEAQQFIYLQLFGFCICLPIKPAGMEAFDASYATSLWNIPPYMVEIKEKNTIFYQTDLQGIIDSITLTYKGEVSLLPLKDIFIFRDYVPSADSVIIPSSRVAALELPIRNTIAAYLSRNELINYAGSQGVFTPEKDAMGAIPVTAEEKQQLQEDARRQYGIQRGQWRYIIAPAAMKWQEMGKPTKDLMLFEEVEEDSKAICDGYGYPPHLMGLLDPSFNNQDKAEKGLFQNTIIPESQNIYEQWQEFLGLSAYNLTITKDYSRLPVLQDDEVARWQARFFRDRALQIEFLNDLITQNEWRETNELDDMTDGDKYYSDIKDDIGAVKLTTGAALETATTTQNNPDDEK